MKKYRIGLKYFFGFCLLLGAMLEGDAAILATQYFDSAVWTTAGSTFGPTNAEGWTGENVNVHANTWPPQSGTKSLWLNAYSLTTNSWIQTPLFSNGIGRIGFYAACRVAGGFNSFVVKSSTNGIDWSDPYYSSNITTTTWTTNLALIDTYNPSYVRFYKSGDNTNVNQFLGLDTITIEYPASKVIITNVAPSSNNPPMSNDVITFQATLIPLGVVSNLTATNFWRIGTSGGWSAIGMTSGAMNVWFATNSIPAQPTGTTVQYYVTASFSGYDAYSPTSYPTAGASTPLFYVVRSFPTSGYQPRNMYITGDINSNMYLLSNYVWQGVAETQTPLIDAKVRWRGTPTNSPSTTNFWGDTNQVDFILPIIGNAETNGTNIIIPGTNSGQFIISFVETNAAYRISRGYAQHFDSWPPDQTSNNNWILTAGGISPEAGRAIRDSWCYLAPSGTLRSPFLAAGIGDISFWYRNYQTNGLPAGALVLQRSMTGGTNDSEWSNIGTFGTITNTTYLRYTLTVEDRNSFYFRLNNTSTPATVCVDEVQVTDPYYSGVILSNLTSYPIQPNGTNPVAITVDVHPVAGAAISNVNLFYRPSSVNPSTPAYSNISMSLTSGNTYSATIPAGIGQTNGAGSIQYYVRCSFTGDQSSITSPAYSPSGGSNNPAVYTIQMAYVDITNLVLSPDPPLAGSNTAVTVTATPQAAASNLTAYIYYRYGASGAFSSNTLSPAGGNLFNGTIPAQSNPGSPLHYFTRVVFLGAGTLSPMDYPSAGPSGPFTNLYRAAPITTLYTNTTLSGSFTNPLIKVTNNVWQGVGTISNLVNPSFRFVGYDAGSNVWGDSNQSVTNPPVFGVAETGSPPIIISGTNTGHYVFRYNETSHVYSVQQCAYLDFDDWTNATAFGTSTNSENWVMFNSRTTLTNDPIDSTRVLSYRSGILNDSGSTPYIQSPYLSEGIGEISFWCRNWNIEGLTNGGFSIQVAVTPAGPWTQVTQVTNLLSIDYLYFTVSLSDRSNHYVRIYNTTVGTPPRLCLDEIIIAAPPAGIAYSNLVHTPSSPTATNAVSVSVDFSLLAGASNTTATLWYRPGTSGSFISSISMTNGGGRTYTTVTPIPQGIGLLGGAGPVQYYVLWTFQGYNSSLFSPTNLPTTPATYTIQNAYVIITNVALVPDPPLVGTNLLVAADVLPMAAASNITVNASYRWGASGGFTTNIAMALTASNRYVSPVGIPIQPNPGTPLYYYIRADFGGPNAMTPTNSPAGGSTTPLTAIYRTPALATIYSNLTTQGSVTSSFLRISNYTWQGVTYVTNLNNGSFTLAGFDGITTNFWGDNNPSVSNLPVYGFATNAGGNPILMAGTNSGHIMFHYEETNKFYYAQRCAYMNFDEWSTPNTYTNYTNSDWIISAGLVTSNSYSYYAERTFMGQGRSCILNDGGGTQYVQSPFLADGVGEISFWCRNWESNGLTRGGFFIEKAASTNGPWIKVGEVTNLLAVDFVYYSVGVSDRDNHYVRINNATHAGHSRLCLDEIAIAAPPAGVVFSNLTTTPSAPSITDTVAVAVDIYPLIGASNLSARVFYRSGTNGLFDVIALTNVSGTLFTTSATNPIPRGPEGIVQYYVECSYQGFLSFKTSPLYYPPEGSNGVMRSYTNSQSFRQQNFDSSIWTPNSGSSFGSTNNDGWYCESANVHASTWTPASTPRACWLSYIDNTNAWIVTPLLTNGVNRMYFAFAMRAAAVSANFQIESSADGLTFTNILTNYTCSVSTWATQYCSVATYDPIYLRLRVTSSSTNVNSYLGVDNIIITYPPALTVISNVMVHPGYPALMDNNVTVSCDIYSVNPFSPAYGITPYLYYKKSGDGSYSNPITMSRVALSNNSYRTTQPLPQYSKETFVTFFVSNSFKGYSYSTNVGSVSFNETMSPVYFPPPVGSTTNFWIRRYLTDFSGIGFMLNGSNVTMRQYADNAWQGVFSVDNESNGFSMALSGLSNYNGTGYSSAPYGWGDNYQWKTNLPLYSTAQQGGSNIFVPGNFTGQFVVKFNEESGVYLAERCVWQDFDSWGTSTNYIASGNDNSPPYLQNMDGITSSLNRTALENFSSGGASIWSICTGFTNEFTGGTNGWTIYNARIPAAFPQTCEITNVPALDRGFIVRRQDYATPFRGVGTVSLKYRTNTTNIPSNVGVGIYLCPTNLDYQDPGNWTNVFVVNDFTNAIFTNASFTVNTATTYHVIIGQSKAGSAGSFFVDDVNVDEWYASTVSNNGWVAYEAWITTNDALIVPPDTSGNCCEFDASRADGEMYLQSPLITDGIGFFDFWYRGKTTNTVSFTVDVQRFGESAWTTFASVTNSTTNWTFKSYNILSNGMVFVRIKSTSASKGVLLVDDVQATHIPVSETWLCNVAQVDASDPNRRYLNRSMFLNSNLTDNVGTPIYPGSIYLQTPLLEEGFGEVSFRYRNWTTNGTPPVGMLAIQKSMTGTTNDADWTTFAYLSNITNINDYNYYSMSTYDSTSRYVRIVNNINGSRVCLDDVLVAAPMAAGFSMSNLTISPLVPINSNTVTVSVYLYDKFLNPSNISVKTYYAYDTNYNGAGWSNEFALAMTCVASNETDRWFLYQTAPTLIPAKPTDTYVKYYIKASFDGFQSDKASPLNYKAFSKPTWYNPIDYGTNIPYYIVYNCKTGAVWINEFNVTDWTAYPQYIELVGPAGIDIGNWSVEIFNNSSPTPAMLAKYTIPTNSILPSTTNGFGFYVLAESGLAGRNLTISNSTLPLTGGIVLKRSMGAREYAIAYGLGSLSSLIATGFVNVGYDDDTYDYAVSLYGTGTNYSDFSWGNTVGTEGVYTPGIKNQNQTVVGGNSDFLLTPLVDLHGLISPSIPFYVPSGATTNFIITADPYWRVSDVQTNGGSIGGIGGQSNSYTFVYSNIVAAGTVRGVISANLASNNTPYWWLAQYGFTNNFNAAETNDADYDGIQTWKEYVAGTVPTNATSLFRIIGQGRQYGSNYIRWIGGTAGPTYPYGIVYSTNLTTNIWTATGSVTRVNGTNTWWGVVRTNWPAIFFKVTATNAP